MGFAGQCETNLKTWEVNRTEIATNNLKKAFEGLPKFDQDALVGCQRGFLREILKKEIWPELPWLDYFYHDKVLHIYHDHHGKWGSSLLSVCNNVNDFLMKHRKGYFYSSTQDNLRGFLAQNTIGDVVAGNLSSTQNVEVSSLLESTEPDNFGC